FCAYYSGRANPQRWRENRDNRQIVNQTSTKRAVLSPQWQQRRNERLLLNGSKSRKFASDIQVMRESGALLNELETQFGLIAHQAVDCASRFLRFVLRYGHPQMRALAARHRGFLELRRHHLAQPLEPADLDLALARELLFQKLVLVGVIAGIKCLATLSYLVERRHGHIEMPAANKLRQLPIEEGDEKRGDMRAVHIGVGHDDDLVVAQIFFAVVVPGAHAQRKDQITDLLVLRHLGAARAYDVQDLASERKHSLARAVACLLCRAAGAVTLNDEDFGAICCRLRAIGELAGQAQFPRRGFPRHVFLL